MGRLVRNVCAAFILCFAITSVLIAGTPATIVGWQDDDGACTLSPSTDTCSPAWHYTWPGHTDMYLTPAQCQREGQHLDLNCPSSCCRGYFTCVAIYQCPNGEQPDYKNECPTEPPICDCDQDLMGDVCIDKPPSPWKALTPRGVEIYPYTANTQGKLCNATVIPLKQCPTSGPRSEVGNPISCTSGSKVQVELDYNGPATVPSMSRPFSTREIE